MDLESFQLDIIVVFFLNAKIAHLFVGFHTWFCIQKPFLSHAMITLYL